MSEAVREHRVRRPGGVLAVQDRGSLDAPVVIAHHGTPSCRLDVPGGPGAAEALGIRVVSFDRPGYGESTSVAGRCVADAAGDAAAVADALGIERFGVIGTSGGGPHALATAALAPERVTGVCVVVGLGPVADDRFDATAGMLPATVEEIEAARRGPEEVRAFIEAQGAEASEFDAWLGSLPPRDRELLARADVASLEEAVAAHWGSRYGIEGWAEDDLALFARPWGFDPGAVDVPVELIYGEADVLVPADHGRAYAELLPAAALTVVPGAGHWMPDEQRGALARLAERETAITTWGV